MQEKKTNNVFSPADPAASPSPDPLPCPPGPELIQSLRQRSEQLFPSPWTQCSSCPLLLYLENQTTPPPPRAAPPNTPPSEASYPRPQVMATPCSVYPRASGRPVPCTKLGGCCLPLYHPLTPADRGQSLSIATVLFRFTYEAFGCARSLWLHGLRSWCVGSLKQWHLWSWCTGFSRRWRLWLWHAGARHMGFSSCGPQAQ